MKPWLYVGAPVVCVSTELPPGWGNDPRMPTVEVGVGYTISRITPAFDDDELVLRVAEIEYPADCDARAYGFPVSFFRPLLPDTKRAVNEMRNLMQDATVRGKVDA